MIMVCTLPIVSFGDPIDEGEIGQQVAYWGVTTSS